MNPPAVTSSAAVLAGVPDQEVGGPEGDVVHRAAGVDAEIEKADPAGKLLDRGLHAAFEDVECHRGLRQGTGTSFCAASWRRRNAVASVSTSRRKPR